MLRKTLSIMVLATSLSGCFGAFIAGTALGGLVVYEGRNLSTQKKDVDISSVANQRIAADHELKEHSRIVISAYDGVILLAGQTPTEALRNRAGDVVNSVPGARRVYNEITVGAPIAPLIQSNDAWITTKVKSSLVSAKGLNSSQIKVVSENGTVFLLGKVTRRQADLATQISRTVEGVQKVILLFEYE